MKKTSSKRRNLRGKASSSLNPKSSQVRSRKVKRDYNLGFRLGKIFAITALLIGGIGKMAHAQSRCEISQSVRGCVKSLDQLSREQEKNGPKLGAIDINKSFRNLIAEVNGKNLIYSHWSGTYVMKVTAKENDVRLELNGEKIQGEQLCYEVCSNEDKVTWYHPEQGAVKRVKNGLTVNGRYFKLQ